MRRIVLCLGILLAWPLAGQAAKPAKPASIEFGAGAWVDVDATGKAHVVKMEKLRQFQDDGTPGSLADVIKARLRQRIESWEFTPPMKSGVPAPGKTHLRMSLLAASDDGRGLAIRIIGAVTGAELLDVRMQDMTRALVRGTTGMTVVKFAWREDGSIDNADIVSTTSLSNRNTTASLEPTGRKAFLAIVKQWRIEPEWVDGTPIGGSGMVPISFCFEGDSCASDSDMSAKPDQPGLQESDPAVALRTAVADSFL